MRKCDMGLRSRVALEVLPTLIAQQRKKGDQNGPVTDECIVKQAFGIADIFIGVKKRVERENPEVSGYGNNFDDCDE